jgi:hypothetical protein
MWRYLAWAAAGILLIAAGMTFQAMRSPPAATLAAMPAAAAETATPDGQATSPAVPEALPATREQKRFDRYDKDRNGSVTRDEYLMARRKAFAKLDVDNNGTLSFDEWAVKAETKFALADKDKSGTMNATEFATTAVKRKSKPRPNCRPTSSAPASAPAEDNREEDS